MSNFRPIAMKCTQEQFNEIKPKLTNLQSVTTFTKDMYLTNNLSGMKGIISNIPDCNKRDYNREVHEEWNERIFLEACGIGVETLKEKEQRLLKELEEVKALIEEENKPKLGDWCKFWDDDKSNACIGKLKVINHLGQYKYQTPERMFLHCEKITDKDFLKALKNL